MGGSETVVVEQGPADCSVQGACDGRRLASVGVVRPAPIRWFSVQAELGEFAEVDRCC